MKAKLTGLALVVSLASMPLQALQYPTSSPYDHRIRTISYNPDDVTQIETVIGVATHIELEPGEKVITPAFGDSDAYQFGSEGHHVFLKPIADQADTNLVLVTDRRSYAFRLSLRDDRNNAIYQVRFSYPEEEAERRRIALEEERRRQRVEDGFSQQRDAYNLEYTMAGDEELAPINAWDNGEHTFFKFQGNREIPSIFYVNADGEESLVNRTTRGESNNIIVIHTVAAEYRLRLGDRVLGVYNENYTGGIANDTGTSSPVIERTIRGGEE